MVHDVELIKLPAILAGNFINFANTLEGQVPEHTILLDKTAKLGYNAPFFQPEESQGELLAAQLLDMIPPEFEKWRVEAAERVISDLLAYGIATRKYRRDEGDDYGYSSLEEFAERQHKLEESWSDLVSMNIVWDGNYRFEVTFTAK